MGQSNGVLFKEVAAFRRCHLIEVSPYAVFKSVWYPFGEPPLGTRERWSLTGKLHSTCELGIVYGRLVTVPKWMLGTNCLKSMVMWMYIRMYMYC